LGASIAGTAYPRAINEAELAAGKRLRIALVGANKGIADVQRAIVTGNSGIARADPKFDRRCEKETIIT